MNRAAALLIALVAARADARGTLSEDCLAKKEEGVFVTGLPLVNFTSDTGFGYGARVYVHDDGHKGDACFATTPYQAEWYVNLFQTTSGWQYHNVSVDLPAIGGGDWRMRAQAIYERDTNRNYFGQGAASMRGLPGSTFAANLKALEASTPAGPGSTDGWHNKYALERPVLFAQTERQIGGAFSAMAAVQAQHTRISTYDGKKVTVTDGSRIQGPTRLAQEAPAGIAGGWSNFLRAGVAADTRDFEPAPKIGWFADATAEWAAPWTGSDYAYTRETVTVRRYQETLPGLVVAARAAWSGTQGRPPFYDEATLGFLDSRTEALGGGWTLRGYKENRFNGLGVAVANLELRYDLGEQQAWGQRFLFTPVAFADGGRVFDHAGDFTFTDWKAAAGGGIRIAWNQSTILNATYGRSGEDTNIFINFGHMF